MAKTISGSVGKGGSNRPSDVVIVQYLLNCVPPGEGGPQEELALDGICGPKTNAAILRLQKKIAGSGLGWLDVGGPTFKQLSGFDPYPDYKLNLSGSKSSGKHGSDHVHKVKTGSPSSSVKDPWGYYDPSGSKHLVKGYAPPAKFGGEQQKGSGKHVDASQWKLGSSNPGSKWDSSAASGKHGENAAAKQGWKLGGKGSDSSAGKQAWKLGGKDSDSSAGKGAAGKQDLWSSGSGGVKSPYGLGKHPSGGSGWKDASGAGGKNEFGGE